MKLHLFRQIFEETQIQNFMKIRPVGAELFHADRQTDMTKLIFTFRNFANASKIRLGGQEILYHIYGTEGSIS